MNVATKNKIEPVVLKAVGPDRLLIVWNDGHRDVFTWEFLREHCPCAVCRVEAEKPKPLLQVLKPQEAQPTRPVSIDPVGRYAYQMTWNDGHSTGIYAFEYLLALGRLQGPSAAIVPQASELLQAKRHTNPDGI